VHVVRGHGGANNLGAPLNLASTHHRKLGDDAMSDKPRDAFYPDRPPPRWVDELGNFGGWLSEAEAASIDAAYAKAIADTLTDDEVTNHEVDLADLLAGGDATDDEMKC
jgi:hypothetical protein